MNTEWKPIESAPKDGTPVLLFARHVYAESSTRVVGAYLLDYGWLAQSYAGQGSARLDPSHWMALPPFPDSPPAPTSHPIPTGATGERDWELACDECNGSGHVFVKHQVAERKTDVQEFKEECEACQGRGFNIAFKDIPGISEYVKSCRPAATAATEGEKKEAVAYQMRLLTTGPHGEWQACTQETYESTKKTGTYCGFRNGPAAEVRALPAPAAGDAPAWHGLTDAERNGFVGEIADYGTDFVSPLYAVVENIEWRLRDKNAAIAQQSQRKEA